MSFMCDSRSVVFPSSWFYFLINFTVTESTDKASHRLAMSNLYAGFGILYVQLVCANDSNFLSNSVLFG